MGNVEIYRDLELAKLLQERNHDAYQEIYNRYWAILFIHANKMLRDEMIATDIVQDIFEDLWTKCDTLQIKTSLKSYLYQAVRFRTLDALRKSNQHVKFLSSLTDFANTGYNSTEEEFRLKELMDRIEAEVELLPPRMRKVFEMSRLLGESHKNIAKELDITDHTVKKTLNRVLHILRSKITMLLLGGV